jgi:hypothetical protein
VTHADHDALQLSSFVAFAKHNVIDPGTIEQCRQNFAHWTWAQTRHHRLILQLWHQINYGSGFSGNQLKDQAQGCIVSHHGKLA